jgi:signal transduction histidine kinase
VATPIKELASSAARISQGQLDARVAVQSNDELGLLSEAFNHMAANLAHTLQQVVADSNRANVILNNVSEGILALDEQGQIVLANSSAAVLIGDLPHTIVGKSVQSLYQWTVNGAPFRPSLTEIGVYPDVVLTSLHKRVHYVDVLVNPIKEDPNGIRSIVTILDRSQERELENMKVDFVSMAAHELRTPMTSIRGYVDLIQRDTDFTPPDTIRDYISHIESSSVQLVGLINNLLNVSRIERGTLTLHRDKVDWAQVVQQSIADQQFAAKTKSVELTYEGPEQGVYIFADQLAISEIINNLVSNAINHTLEGGHVTVRVEASPTGVKTQVIDDGVGIPHDSLPFLFTKFYRARHSLTSGSGGTGLGLFISRSIAELHEGTIAAESEEGKGATFTVELPPFDEEKYNEHTKLRVGNVTQNHGWIIKNTARRR